eukprot:g16937.t1
MWLSNSCRLAMRRVQQEDVLAKEALERLRQMKVRSEAQWQEKVEAESQLQAAQLKKRCAQELTETLDIRQKEALARLSSLVDCTAAKDLERWQQRLKVLGESVRQLRCTLQQLEVSTKGANTVGVSLQEELQRVFLATEKLRREREEATRACWSLHWSGCGKRSPPWKRPGDERVSWK